MTTYMKEARRWPGSEWMKDHPAALEKVYDLTKRAAAALYPAMKRVSPRATERLMIWAEEVGKGYVWNCRMCGQCILHSTGMTCPMNCPKKLRNGPCGGVRPNGHCEVKPQMRCVWVRAYERSQRMGRYSGEMLWIQPPVNRSLQGGSAWVHMLTGADVDYPEGWRKLPSQVAMREALPTAGRDGHE